MDQLALAADACIAERHRANTAYGQAAARGHVAEVARAISVIQVSGLRRELDLAAEKIIDLMAQVVVAEAERDMARLRPWHLAWWRA